MRSLVLALGVALGLFAFTHTADARPRRAKKTVATKSHKASPHKRDKPSQRNAKRHGRIAVTAHTHRHIEIRGPIAGQSIGAPWQGRLREPVRLAENDAWVIRRPWRSFGTHTTVEYVEHVLADIAYRFPGIHLGIDRFLELSFLFFREKIIDPLQISGDHGLGQQSPAMRTRNVLQATIARIRIIKGRPTGQVSDRLGAGPVTIVLMPGDDPAMMRGFTEKLVVPEAHGFVP